MTEVALPRGSRAVRGPALAAPAPRVAVLVPTVWSARNVVHAGVARRLADRGIDVHLVAAPLTDAPTVRLDMERAGALHALLTPATHPVRGKPLLDDVIRDAFWRRHDNASYPIYQRWNARRAGPRDRARATLVRGLGALGTAPGAMAGLQRLVDQLDRRARALHSVRAQLAAIAPDLVWSTGWTSGLEQSYLFAARDLRIPVAASILSFDNLTSRSVTPEFDHYLVWHEGMRRQLLRLYPNVPADAVTVTGTPQFDFHQRADCRWDRPTTLAVLGLPAGARYLVYAASHVSLAPDEPALVQAFVKRLAASEALGDLHLVVRLHPLETGARWDTVRESSSRVTLMSASSRPSVDGRVPWLTLRDQARLVSALLHAAACINIASTMTLDAAILDRPVIGVEFSGEPDAPRDILYEEYDAEHYRPLVERGGLRLARRWDELLDLVHDAIRSPERDAARRADMVRHECGTMDGRAAERVADEIATLTARAAACRGA